MDPPPRKGEQRVVSLSGINRNMVLTALFLPPGYRNGERGYFLGKGEASFETGPFPFETVVVE
jgi:hypothetical protein